MFGLCYELVSNHTEVYTLQEQSKNGLSVLLVKNKFSASSEGCGGGGQTFFGISFGVEVGKLLDSMLVMITEF